MQRRPNPHLAFGYGVHFCPGAPLGRLEGRIAFELLTQSIPNMRLVPDQQFEYGFRHTSYGYKSIRVQWD
jgi:cytochrome P450